MELDNKYYIKTPIYELKYSEKKDWNIISEKAALENLMDNFECVSPIIDKMLQGKEIFIQDYIYRIRKP